MTDPLTSLGAGLAILGSKDLLNKILGPTADYIGGEFKSLVEKCNINLNHIFAKAYRKLGNQLEKPGIVSPRILKNIIDEGRFCEDEVSREYFAGVLASSRTEKGRDDRGLPLIKLVSTLSTYQLRTHYIFYSLIRKLFLPYNTCVSPGMDRKLMVLYIPTDGYIDSMDLSEDFSDVNEQIKILAHCMNGLKRADLIESNYFYGNKQNVSRMIKKEYSIYRFSENLLSDHGIVFQATPNGMDLYLWAHGMGNHSHFQFLDNNITFDDFPGISLQGNAHILFEDIVKSRISKNE